MKKSLSTLAILALLLSFGGSHAAGYVGVSAGPTFPDEDGFDDSTGYRISVGYEINPNVAIEGSYTNLGEFDADDDLIADLEFFTGVALDDVSVEVDGIELALVGKAPLTDMVSIFGKVGIFMWDADFKIDTVSFGSDSDSDDGSDPFFGAGVSFDIGQRIALAIDYSFYEASDGDIDFLAAGVNVKF